MRTGTGLACVRGCDDGWSRSVAGVRNQRGVDLAKLPVDVMLADRKNYRTFQPAAILEDVSFEVVTAPGGMVLRYSAAPSGVGKFIGAQGRSPSEH